MTIWSIFIIEFKPPDGKPDEKTSEKEATEPVVEIWQNTEDNLKPADRSKIEQEAENIESEAKAETLSDLNRKQTPTPRNSDTKETPTPRDSLKRQNTGITSPPPIIEESLENLTPLEEILNKVK